MQLVCGGYTFPDNEISLRVHKQRKYSPRGRKMTQEVFWEVIGSRLVDGAAALTASLATLEASINDGNDLVLYDNDGSPTIHTLSSSGSLSGVQVLAPVEYPGGNPGVWGMSTEYVNRRTYRIRFRAEYLDYDDGLVMYSASLTRIGDGGPKNVWSQSLTGIPIPQTVRQYTKCLLIQQGRSVGLLGYPIPDPPLFGNPYINNDRVRLTEETPRQLYANASLMWPVSWTYTFESPGVL